VKSQQGHGLILALVVLVVMMTALGLLASSLRMGMQGLQREIRTVSLIALTDAAMAETLAFLADDDRFDGVQEHAFGDGLISSEVRPLAEKRVEIIARATFGGHHRTLRAEVRLARRGPLVLRLSQRGGDR